MAWDGLAGIIIQRNGIGKGVSVPSGAQNAINILEHRIQFEGRQIQFEGRQLISLPQIDEEIGKIDNLRKISFTENVRDRCYFNVVV